MSSFASPFFTVLKKLGISGQFIEDRRHEKLPRARPA
jgi:hypothetical protein